MEIVSVWQSVVNSEMGSTVVVLNSLCNGIASLARDFLVGTGKDAEFKIDELSPLSPLSRVHLTTLKQPLSLTRSAGLRIGLSILCPVHMAPTSSRTRNQLISVVPKSIRLGRCQWIMTANPFNNMRVF